MKTGLVTIVIPVFNVEKYLVECLESVIRQTYENLEVICIDDGSDDHSWMILEKYARKDLRIKIFKQNNRGLSASRNKGLKYASGEYCYFLDSDDKLYDYSIERMIMYMTQYNLDILYFSGAVIYEEENLRLLLPNENRIWVRKNFLDRVYSGKDYFLNIFEKSPFPSPVQIQCYKTEFLKSNQILFTEGYIHEDIYFTYKSALYAEKVMAVKDALYIRRVRADSIVTKKVNERNFEGRFTAFFDILLLNTEYKYLENPSLNKIMDKYLNLAYENAAIIYRRLTQKDRLKIKFWESTKKMLFQKLETGLKEINDIPGYGEASVQKEKIILIGAGKIGQDALNYFGKHKVAFFADNDLQKTGKKYNGIEVVAVTELKKYEKSHDLIICANRDRELAEQLRNQKIFRFYNFKKSTVYELEKFLTVHKAAEYRCIALYGTGKDAMRIYNDIKSIRFIELKYIIDRDDSPDTGREWNGFTVKKLADVQDKIDCIIVASNRYHMAIAARIQRQNGCGFKVLDPFILQSYNKRNMLIVNNYDTQGAEAFSEEEYNLKSSERVSDFDAINEYINEIEQMEKIPLFGHVEIETINRCNGTCSFCPVNKYDDTRILQKMTDELFQKIVLELEDMDYDGRIAPFSNNEPFLDEKIIDRVKYMRRHLPKARIHLFTNGTLLTLEKYLEIIDSLDELIIDNYDQALEVIEPVRSVADYCIAHPGLIEKTDIVLRKPDEILSSRGGDAPNRQIKQVFAKVKCALPYRQLIIRPSGEVSLCCNDPLGKCTLGNVSDEKIVDIWYGEKFRQVRKRLKAGRENFQHCRYCDTFYLN